MLVKDWLGKKVKVLMDRPLGSGHPEFQDNIYPVNYGYIPNTISEVDNEEIDAYVLGPSEPLLEFSGIVIAVVQREDSEIKLIVTDGRDFSQDEILQQIDFQEKYHKSKLIK